MSQDEIVNWVYIAPSTLWSDCDQDNVSLDRSVFHLDGSSINLVSIATIYADHTTDKVFSIEYYRKDGQGINNFVGLREPHQSVELALFGVSLRVQERFDLNISYGKALKEYYEYRSE